MRIPNFGLKKHPNDPEWLQMTFLACYSDSKLVPDTSLKWCQSVPGSPNWAGSWVLLLITVDEEPRQFEVAFIRVKHWNTLNLLKHSKITEPPSKITEPPSKMTDLPSKMTDPCSKLFGLPLKMIWLSTPELAHKGTEEWVLLICWKWNTSSNMVWHLLQYSMYAL